MLDRKKDKGKKGKMDFDRDELFYNEEDRIMLNNKPELVREQILDERYKAKLKEEERKQLLKEKIEKENKTDQDKKRDALEDIRKKRQNNRKDSDSSESESGEIIEDDEENDSESEDYYLSLSENEKEKPKKEIKSSFKLTLYELEKIRVSRVMIEKWWQNSFFESTVIGCFIRINVCRDKAKNNFEYIVAQIKDIVDKPDKPYSFMGKSCTKYINALYTKYEKLFNFAIISNSPFAENEYNIWLNKMNDHNLPLPNEDIIKKKIEELHNAENYKYSSEEIKEIITKKKEQKLKNFEKNINITYEMSMLNEEYNSALMKLKENEKNKEKEQSYRNKVNELKEKLEILNKMLKEREINDTEFAEQDIVSQINKKNLEKQKKNDLRLSMINKKKQREEDGNVNFFRRRECKPTNLWNSGITETENKEISNSVEKNNISSTNTNEPVSETKENVTHNQRINNIEIKTIIEKIKTYTEDFDKLLVEKPLTINKSEGCSYPNIFPQLSTERLYKLLSNSGKPEGVKFVTLDDLKYDI